MWNDFLLQIQLCFEVVWMLLMLLAPFIFIGTIIWIWVYNCRKNFELLDRVSCAFPGEKNPKQRLSSLVRQARGF